ncbi:MAG TPA: beta-ketoacyl reductase, partial [Ramlibacter sp.]
PALEVHTGSLADRDALQRCFADVRARLGPVRGVVHCAGVYSNPAQPGFAAKSLEGMQRVWEPKAHGLLQLQAVLGGDPLDFFVTVSSLAGLVPSLARGASDYAMAHGFVDFAMAWQRRHDPRGVLHRNIFWADWNDTGAFTRVGGDKAAAAERAFGQIGLRSFDSAQGCALFDLALAPAPEAAVLVGVGDRAAFERALPTLLQARPGELPAAPAPDSLRQQIERWEAAHRSGQGPSAAQLAQVIGLDEIRKLEPALIHRIHGLLQPSAAAPAPDPVATVVTDTVMEVLKLKRLDAAQTFQSHGLDSISAMVVATRLEKRLGRPVQASWLVEHCTVQALARHLLALDAQPR